MNKTIYEDGTVTLYGHVCEDNVSDQQPVGGTPDNISWQSYSGTEKSYYATGFKFSPDGSYSISGQFPNRIFFGCMTSWDGEAWDSETYSGEMNAVIKAKLGKIGNLDQVQVDFWEGIVR